MKFQDKDRRTTQGELTLLFMKKTGFLIDMKMVQRNFNWNIFESEYILNSKNYKLYIYLYFQHIFDQRKSTLTNTKIYFRLLL